MALFILGVNYRTAPLAVRERVVFHAEELRRALGDLAGGGRMPEAAILSTCNRTEVYGQGGEPEAAARWLTEYRGLSPGGIEPCLYTLTERAAARHAFRVASGLDSMVLGEPQILGQMKEAARAAREAGALGATLHKLFQQSFSVAKDVRSGTAIGASIVSMAAAAVRLAERLFGNVAEQSVLFIGAGEMIGLCAAHFAAQRPRALAVANRTLDRAGELADKHGGQAIRLEDVAGRLAEFDIVISCTASQLPIIGLGLAERAVRARRHRPILMVDLAVPRDIEPEVGRLDDVFLYTVDDLAQIVESGRESRQAAAAEAEAIVEARADDFMSWLRARESAPLIRVLRENAEALRQSEMERARRRLAAGEAPEAVLEALSRRLTNKYLHAPTQALNRPGTPEEARTLIAGLFGEQDFD